MSQIWLKSTRTQAKSCERTISYMSPAISQTFSRIYSVIFESISFLKTHSPLPKPHSLYSLALNRNMQTLLFKSRVIVWIYQYQKAVTLCTLFLYLQNIFNTRDDKKNICAVGFEPNPNHVLPLREIELSFAKCGWRTKFFTETAVSNYTGKRIMVGTWFG